MTASLRTASALIALFAISADASAQNLDAGKSPNQLFSGNCAACHRSAKGLSKSPNVGQVAGFLRQHYTTSREMAGTLAAYVVSSGVDASGRRAREAAQDSGRADSRRERQAARTEPGAPETPPQAQTREERAAARRAAAEAETKRLERLERGRIGLASGGDPAPVQISSQPIALAHDRHSSRADSERTYSPKPTAEKPAVTAALPSSPPTGATVPPASESGNLAAQTQNPAGEPAGPAEAPASGAASVDGVQPFSAPLP